MSDSKQGQDVGLSGYVAVECGDRGPCFYKALADQKDHELNHWRKYKSMLVKRLSETTGVKKRRDILQSLYDDLLDHQKKKDPSFYPVRVMRAGPIREPTSKEAYVLACMASDSEWLDEIQQAFAADWSWANEHILELVPDVLNVRLVAFQRPQKKIMDRVPTSSSSSPGSLAVCRVWHTGDHYQSLHPVTSDNWKTVLLDDVKDGCYDSAATGASGTNVMTYLTKGSIAEVFWRKQNEAQTDRVGYVQLLQDTLLMDANRRLQDDYDSQKAPQTMIRWLYNRETFIDEVGESTSSNKTRLQRRKLLTDLANKAGFFHMVSDTTSNGLDAPDPPVGTDPALRLWAVSVDFKQEFPVSEIIRAAPEIVPAFRCVVLKKPYSVRRHPQAMSIGPVATPTDHPSTPQLTLSKSVAKRRILASPALAESRADVNLKQARESDESRADVNLKKAQESDVEDRLVQRPFKRLKRIGHSASDVDDASLFDETQTSDLNVFSIAALMRPTTLEEQEICDEITATKASIDEAKAKNEALVKQIRMKKLRQQLAEKQHELTLVQSRSKRLLEI